MPKLDGTKEYIISRAFDKWADKKWFQVLTIIIIIYLLSAPVAGPLIYQYINKSNTSEAVVETLIAREKQVREEHKMQFERSKQLYALAKTILNEYLDKTCSDYIFLVEFHNGMENVISGIQFCRFDITLEVLRDNLPYINQEKFKDDIVARYDVFLKPEFENTSNVFAYKIEDLYEVDRYLEQQLRYLQAKECAFINLSDKNGNIIGSLLFVSVEENIDIVEIYECQRKIENIFK